MKILNLYAGIGGNRKLWPDEHEITAVEIDPKIAEIYHDFFPNDTMIVGDAHQYLLDHFKEFDFIWSSPPCPTHSQVNHYLHAQGCIRYPDMKLWQEIIFLEHFCKTKYCIENVKSYYKCPFMAQVIGRHYFWCNFDISGYGGKLDKIGSFAPTKKGRTDEKDYRIRNMVEPELGLHILKESQKGEQQTFFKNAR